MDMLMDDIAGIWPSGRLPHHVLLREAVEALSLTAQSSNYVKTQKHADIELVIRALSELHGLHCTMSMWGCSLMAVRAAVDARPSCSSAASCWRRYQVGEAS